MYQTVKGIMVNLKKLSCHSAVLSSEARFRNGQNTEEENMELENSIKTQKDKFVVYFFFQYCSKFQGNRDQDKEVFIFKVNAFENVFCHWFWWHK